MSQGGGELVQLPVGLLGSARLLHVLAQEGVDLGPALHGRVEYRVGARAVGADRDEVLLLAEGGQCGAQPLPAARTSGVTISPIRRETLWSTSMAG